MDDRTYSLSAPRAEAAGGLKPTEVAALFQNTPNLKQRTILMTIYAAGLRVSELINLRVTDIDSQRQLIAPPSYRPSSLSTLDTILFIML